MEIQLRRIRRGKKANKEQTLRRGRGRGRTDGEVLGNNNTGGVPAVGAHVELVDRALLVDGDGVVSSDADEAHDGRLGKLEPCVPGGPVADAVGIVPLPEAEAAVVYPVLRADGVRGLSRALCTHCDHKEGQHNDNC